MKKSDVSTILVSQILFRVIRWPMLLDIHMEGTNFTRYLLHSSLQPVMTVPRVPRPTQAGSGFSLAAVPRCERSYLPYASALPRIA